MGKGKYSSTNDDSNWCRNPAMILIVHEKICTGKNQQFTNHTQTTEVRNPYEKQIFSSPLIVRALNLKFLFLFFSQKII